jgi:5-methylcytosine-specific restriction enzyme A
MKQPDADAIASLLSNRFDVDMSGRIGRGTDGDYFIFYPAGFGDEQESFSIEVRLGWRSVDAHFLPGNYSGEMLLEMGRAGPEKRTVFRALAKKVRADGGRIDMRVNGQTVSADETDWPESWRHLTLNIQRAPLFIEDTDEHRKETVSTWGGLLLGMVLALLPLEETQPSSSEPIGLPEGAKTRVEVNRYERAPLNRAACIQAWGPACQVCGFDFGKVYGPVGEGYIHVHHLTPVSVLGPGYMVDPINDLTPVCPNCHAMIHRSDPPYTLDQMRELIRKDAMAAGGSSGAWRAPGGSAPQPP